MGHTTTALIFQHYREVVRPADAAEYWRIFPKEAAENSALVARASWEIPPYGLGVIRDSRKSKASYVVRWKKDGMPLSRHFQNEPDARKWMDEKNAPWFEGKSLHEADDRKKAVLRPRADISGLAVV